MLDKKHYSVRDLAEAWNVSTDLIRDIFKNAEGVLKITFVRRGVRKYVTLRIPHDVAEREYRKLQR